MWPTQSWFKKLLELAVEQPMIIKSILFIPNWDCSQWCALEISGSKHNSKRNMHLMEHGDRTKNKYKYIFRQRETFCSEKNYNTTQVDTDIALEFLTLGYKRRLSYNAISNVLSATGNYLPLEVRYHSIIKKFMKNDLIYDL